MAAIADVPPLRLPLPVRARDRGPRATTRSRLPLRRQIAAPGILCIFIAITVLFPIVWIFSMSIDPRNIVPAGRR